MVRRQYCQLRSCDGGQPNPASQCSILPGLVLGSSNFGIVTRFDMKTFPLHNIYAGFISESGSNVNQLVQAVADFVDPVYGGSLDPKAAMDANLFFDSQTRITSCLSSLFYNSSIVGTPAAFANFTAIPTFSSTLSTRPFTNWLNETLVYGNTPSRYFS